MQASYITIWSFSPFFKHFQSCFLFLILYYISSVGSQRMTTNMAGSYRCIATNGHGSPVEDVMNVGMIGDPPPPPTIWPNVPEIITEGSKSNFMFLIKYFGFKVFFAVDCNLSFALKL